MLELDSSAVFRVLNLRGRNTLSSRMSISSLGTLDSFLDFVNGWFHFDKFRF